ncbi:MAG TPA: HAD hydrolase family protein, partial [Kofleriaceae bacterium]|nr:HAD hydrolase family protein [Kofleriaceae bacterium]
MVKWLSMPLSVGAYRLLALDLDGTLLRHDKRVDDRDIAAIRELAASGVTVTIVTGRLHSGSVDAARACGIVGPIACVEGSHIVDVSTEQTLAHHPMSQDVTELLRATF